ncbi:hypothetical protein VKT23_012550 [Stygiomarasmius scandens]|uniref:Uncharacterized protein n=1 Tax=Marasmiellus scandens TaxID=2682957 RepID=A0ABR1J5Y3_9AGAR
MRFTTILSTIVVAASFVVGQESARFGSVSVSPCPFTGGQDITITYDATTAALAGHQPEFLDLFFQGKFSDTGNPTPRFLISRNDFGADQVIFTQNTTIPEQINIFNAT